MLDRVWIAYITSQFIDADDSTPVVITFIASQKFILQESSCKVDSRLEQVVVITNETCLIALLEQNFGYCWLLSWNLMPASSSRPHPFRIKAIAPWKRAFTGKVGTTGRNGWLALTKHLSELHTFLPQLV